jgi:hypothetical protein
MNVLTTTLIRFFSVLISRSKLKYQLSACVRVYVSTGVYVCMYVGNYISTYVYTNGWMDGCTS